MDEQIKELLRMLPEMSEEQAMRLYNAADTLASAASWQILVARTENTEDRLMATEERDRSRRLVRKILDGQ